MGQTGLTRENIFAPIHLGAAFRDEHASSCWPKCQNAETVDFRGCPFFGLPVTKKIVKFFLLELGPGTTLNIVLCTYMRIIDKSSQSTANGCRQNVLKSVFPTSLDSQSWFSDLIRDEIWIVELQSGNAFSPGEMTQVKKKMGKFRLEATPRTYNLVCDS